MKTKDFKEQYDKDILKIALDPTLTQLEKIKEYTKIQLRLMDQLKTYYSNKEDKNETGIS